MDKYMVVDASHTSMGNFVDFWSSLYAYGDAAYLSNLVEDRGLKVENVLRLMKWKSGPRHASRASEVAHAVDLRAMNQFRARRSITDDDLTDFFWNVAKKTTSTGIVWPIMLAHIARPHDVPIYDVNVWRAWGYIAGWFELHHLHQGPVRFETYLTGYRPFFSRLLRRLGDSHRRDLDRALFRFGQFLKSQLGEGLI